jgi:hypothetical protein
MNYVAIFSDCKIVLNTGKLRQNVMVKFFQKRSPKTLAHTNKELVAKERGTVIYHLRSFIVTMIALRAIKGVVD